MLIDSVRLSVKNLYRKRGRNLLTVLGIAIGVASVVIIASIGDIGKYIINQELDELGVGGVMISADSKVPGAELTEQHLEAVRQSGTVDSAIPIIVDYTKSYMRELMMDTVLWGIDAGANQVISLDIVHGRLITKNDISAQKKVCLVDQNIAQAYYKRDNIVGKTIRFQFASGTEEFEIVGVVASGGTIMQGLMGEFIPSFVYLPYTTVRQFSGKNHFDQIAVKTKDSIDKDVAGAQLLSVCNRLSNVSTGFKVENMQTQKDRFGSILDIITVVLSAIAGVSLLVAGLSIMTVMLVSVHERTREIGIKKSIGASRQNIMFEFLVETFSLSFLGACLGVLAGVFVVLCACLLLKIPPCINYLLVFISVFSSVIVGVIFGIYPAGLASRLNPVEALRCE